MSRALRAVFFVLFAWGGFIFFVKIVPALAQYKVWPLVKEYPGGVWGPNGAVAALVLRTSGLLGDNPGLTTIALAVITLVGVFEFVRDYFREWARPESNGSAGHTIRSTPETR